MILEHRNLEIYGYTSDELLPNSEKPIAVICNECGTERVISKKADTKAKNKDQLCQSCRSIGNKSRTGQTRSEEEIAKQSKSLMGNKSRTGQKRSLEERTKQSKTMMGNTCGLGYKYTPEQSERKSASLKGEDYDAGEWTGFFDKTQPHLIPVYKCFQLNDRFPDSVGHHLTHDTVVFIPAELHRHLYHNMITGENMVEINMLALQYINEEGLFAQECALINGVNCWDVSTEIISSQACPGMDSKVQRLTADTRTVSNADTSALHPYLDDDIV